MHDFRHELKKEMNEVSGPFMAFTWLLSIIAALIATFSLRAARVWGIILGVIVAQGFMFAGAHLLGLAIGPQVNIGGTPAYVVTDIILALVGAFLVAALVRAFRRR